MGVDMTATVEVRYDSEVSGEVLYWSEVATVFCGRLYHWRDLLEDVPIIEWTRDHDEAVMSWAYLRENKGYDIFDGKLSGTHLYVIARALRDLYGPKHVRVRCRAA